VNAEAAKDATENQWFMAAFAAFAFDLHEGHWSRYGFNMRSRVALNSFPGFHSGILSASATR